MPETPDFNWIARTIVAPPDEDIQVQQIAEQLRLIWNARGAADIAKLEAAIPTVWTAAEPAGPLTRALRTLDR